MFGINVGRKKEKEAKLINTGNTHEFDQEVYEYGEKHPKEVWKKVKKVEGNI
jgi:hypothetical protein